MNKEENRIVPQLRFPEFENDGDWKVRSIEENIDMISGIALKSTELTEDKSGTPILRGINITEGCIRHSEEMDKFYLGDISKIKKYLVKEDDIVIGMDGSKVGKNVALVSKFDIGSILIQRVARIRAINSDIKYLYQNFISQKFRSYVDNVNTSSGIPHISAKQIRDFEIGFPPKVEEQQKIANCLSSLDNVITAENEKLNLLKDHKKGLLQQLFPAEGETQPKFRFPEFKNDRDWEEKRLDEITKIVTGSTPKTSDSENYGGNKLFVSPADISEGRYIIKTGKTLSEKGFSKSRIIPANSILFVCIGSTIGKLAQNKIECTTNQQINSLIPFKNNSNDFIYSLLENNSNYIASLSAQQAVPLINKSEFSAVKLHFPTNPKEQQKIANCLSAVDDLIETQVKKIEQLQEHKKGLLQQMFPNVNDL